MEYQRLIFFDMKTKFHDIFKRISLFILFILVSTSSFAQLFAVNTNVALDAVGVPSIGFELVTSNRGTLGIKGFRAVNPLGKDFKATVVQPQWKYFLSGRAKHSHYIGLGGVLTDYKIHQGRHHWNGQGAGGGVIFGYEFNMTKRLSLDIHGGLCALFYKQKDYYDGDNYQAYTGGVQKANGNGMYMLPSDIGITLSYILK